jgi:hypothetical protein
MSLQPLEKKALSWGTSRKDTSILADITYRKSQQEHGGDKNDHDHKQHIFAEHGAPP